MEKRIEILEATALSQFDTEEIEVVQDLLGHRFSRPGLLATALTSAANRRLSRNRVILEGNGRLEYVGDGILHAAVRTHLYRRFPHEAPCFLAWVNDRLTGNRMFADVTRSLGLMPYIAIPYGSAAVYAKTTSAQRKLLSCAFEAIAAALYLDGGMDAVEKFLARSLYPEIETAVAQYRCWLQSVHAQKTRAVTEVERTAQDPVS